MEHLDTFTNDVISAAAKHLGFGSETVEIIFKKRPLQVWEVDSRFIARLQKTKKSFPLDFKVYVRRGNDGVVQEWKFHTQKKPSRKVVKATQKLEDIKNK
ncbi:MAG: hypothetical protein A2Y98_01585 [Candidatus Portnoybacteria bacterium RBG_19FT_COMBO_36_7]|uniref:Uncharacterized protein n=1 Tax=Candidatus Portnoybacteria bacterium RBG_19FT_COMBO_36_7 TaxID=1801992 RepID=A0A1G2F6A6_9BACT|nr:MAG: hypothetical protein A2Y98_01585 [Candidatus Portnoybacteria bacterium RBG_19FT_COMBO_36_7]